MASKAAFLGPLVLIEGGRAFVAVIKTESVIGGKKVSFFRCLISGSLSLSGRSNLTRESQRQLFC